MTPATITLHQNLIRAAKAAIAAWERWLTSQQTLSNSESSGVDSSKT
jgi:hypothetical protein